MEVSSSREVTIDSNCNPDRIAKLQIYSVTRLGREFGARLKCEKLLLGENMEGRRRVRPRFSHNACSNSEKLNSSKKATISIFARRKMEEQIHTPPA